MQSRNRWIVVLCVVLAFAAVMTCATSAFGIVYNAGSMSYALSSPGYSGWWIGWYGPTILNSPVPNGARARWYNQPVSLSRFQLFGVTPTSTITPMATGTYSLNGGVPQSFVTSPTVTQLTAEGVYVFDLVGVNTIGSFYEATSVVGVDRTRPVSWSDAVPVYDGTATVTVTATDTLSGIEMILTSLDGASDVSTVALPASNDSAWVTAGVGSHVLTWLTIDDAGNVEGRNSVSFAVNPLGFKPYVGTVRTSVSRRKVKFSGAVSAITSNATLKLVVQRKVGSKWKNFATYFVTVPKYQRSWSLTKNLGKAGTFRVGASEGTSASAKLTSFRLK